jgi:adenylosuccinate synthase
VKFAEQQINVPITILSNGPRREEVIYRISGAQHAT